MSKTAVENRGNWSMIFDRKKKKELRTKAEILTTYYLYVGLHVVKVTA